LWNIGSSTPDDASDDYRMLPVVVNYGGDNDDAYDFGGEDEHSGAANDPSSDWVYWGNPDDMSPGQAGYDGFHAPGIGSEPSGGWTEVIARTRIMNWNRYLGGGGGGESLDSALAELAMPEVGTVFRWITNKPNTTSDKFTFGTSDETSTSTAYSCDNVNVWPNPYFGQNVEEVNAFDHQMHFTDLPEAASISIFNLNGVLVRKLDHTMGQNEIWDMNNSFGIPVASGMYIAHVDTDACGAVLKLAIINSEQRLDRY